MTIHDVKVKHVRSGRPRRAEFLAEAHKVGGKD
jgi:hypothetical protein